MKANTFKKFLKGNKNKAISAMNEMKAEKKMSVKELKAHEGKETKSHEAKEKKMFPKWEKEEKKKLK